MKFLKGFSLIASDRMAFVYTSYVGKRSFIADLKLLPRSPNCLGTSIVIRNATDDIFPLIDHVRLKLGIAKGKISVRGG